VFPLDELAAAALPWQRHLARLPTPISHRYRKGLADVTSTATTHGARDHARAQAGQRAATQPTVPASSLADPPDGVAAADVLWDEVIGAGGYAAQALPRGSRLRLVDVDGDACAGLVLHRADRPHERLNVADTVKLQWQAYPGPGYLLLSDMGRVLASVVEDTAGSHDTFCGPSNRADNAARYGDGSAHGPTPSGRDRFLVALAKHGLGERDLPPTITLFKGVFVEEDGTVTYRGDRSHAGAAVTLRAEMDVLVSVVDVPHRLDGRPAYTAGRLRLTAWRGAPAGPDDPCRTASPEATRAYENTEDAMALLATAPGAGR
jgi:urea carboxylase-associated protein 2